MPLARLIQVDSRNGVLQCCSIFSRTKFTKCSSVQSRLAKPVKPNPGGKSPRLAKSYTAGISFLRAKSPVMPKITRLHGPAMRAKRKSRGSRKGFVQVDMLSPASCESRSILNSVIDTIVIFRSYFHHAKRNLLCLITVLKSFSAL